MRTIFLIKTILLLSTFYYIVSCSNPADSNDYDDLDVIVVSVRTISVHLNASLGTVKKAKVVFTITNIGSKNISGWKVYFNIHTSNSGQFVGSQKKYFTLNKSEITPDQTIIAQIPEGYGNAVRASLKRIEVW